MPPRGQPVVVGVADHSGWAVLVSAAAADGTPVVVDRRRVPLIDEGVPSQPYHHDTLALPDDESERLLRSVRRSIAACTTRAFEHLAADLASRYRVAAITIRQPPLDRLPSTVKEAHASYHVQCRADGMLYHDAICTAAQQRHWTVWQQPRGEEAARAAEALRVRTADVERFLSQLRTTLGPPWSAEHRNACAAAIAALAGHVRLRLP
jgi:hypothetical protein